MVSAHAVPTREDACPRCRVGTRRIALLTSMVIYFVCDRCRCRWHAVRQV